MKEFCRVLQYGGWMITGLHTLVGSARETLIVKREEHSREVHTHTHFFSIHTQCIAVYTSFRLLVPKQTDWSRIRMHVVLRKIQQQRTVSAGKECCLSLACAGCKLETVHWRQYTGECKLETKLYSVKATKLQAVQVNENGYTVGFNFKIEINQHTEVLVNHR